MNSIIFIQALTLLINLGILILAIFQTKRNIQKYLFISVVLTSSLWLSESLLIYFNSSYIFFITKLIFATVIVVIYALFLFTYYFPQETKYLSKVYLFLLAIPVFVLMGMSAFGFVITAFHLTKGIIIPSYGIAYNFYVGFLFIFAILIVSNLTKNLFNVKGIKRVQMNFLMLGICLTIGLALTTNILLPLFGFHQLTQLGPCFTIIFDFTVLYTIIKHRFMNIKFVLGNIAYLVMLILIINTCFFSTLAIEMKVFDSVNSLQACIFDVIISIFFTPAFIYINKKLNYLNNVYSGVQAKNEVIAHIRDLSFKSLDLEKTLNEMTEYLRSILGIENLYIYADFIDDYYFKCHDEKCFSFIKTNYKLIEDVLTNSNKLYITLEAADQNNLVFPYDTFKKFKIACAMQILLESNNQVLFFLTTNDLENRVFDTSEIHFFNLICREISLFINRAILHQKVLTFNETLQNRVENATMQLQKKNDELQAAYDTAQETARQERDMLDIMGHELRTPATVIKLASYLLDPTATDENSKKQIARIKDSIERQINLINTFINAAKIDNNRMELNFVATSLDQMLKQAVEDHQHEASIKNLELTFASEENLPPVLADNARMREVIDNLITNAVKYTQKGFVRVSCKQVQNEIVVQVVDSGEGIRESDIPELFQKFKRLNNYTQTSDNTEIKMIRPGGTGLGLYVVKGVVEKHRGRIWVESTFGEGSNFSFAIPVATPDEIANHPAISLEHANLFKRYNMGKSFAR